MRNGGMPARVAILRWAWRLFRREWRRQALVLLLLALAVATTVFGLSAVGNTLPSGAGRFGSADYVITMDGSVATLAADIARARAAYPATEVINHRKIPVPGSATAVDLRDQAPGGALGGSMVRLDEGRYPVAAGEIAVSPRTARLFGLHAGSTWQQGGHTWSVVGLVENPSDLLDTFALVAPGQAGPPQRVTILVAATPAQFAAAHRPDLAQVEVRAEASSDATTVVLVMATVGLLFVGLLAAAGFTVLAQRRLRALGMLAAIGARHRHLRLVMLANGALAGVASALLGGALGLAAWFLLAPRLESSVQHRIDRFHLPWPQILLALLLATVTALLAAWWPARAAARVPVVAALSARPPRPRPAHRFALLGALLLAAGLIMLGFARPDRLVLLVAGVAGTAGGVLLLAPVSVAGLATLARACPVASRIALRDLARYRARSGAALAAISLATGIAAAIIVGSGAAQAAAAVPPTGGNLPADELVVWVSPETIQGPVPQLDAAQLSNARAAVTTVATALHAPPALSLNGAVSPQARVETLGDTGLSGKPVLAFGIPHPTANGGVIYRGDEMIALLVASPEILRRYGIPAASVEPTTDVLTSRTDLSRYRLLGAGREAESWQPHVQQAALPAYTSAPSVLITEHGVRALGVTPGPIGWLVHAPQPLTPAQVDQAEATARATGLTVETRPVRADLTPLRTGAVAIGAAVALGVLAMTVGLIRGEAARDLRTLTANGAARRTRRRLTAATAAALAILGAALGTAGAYAALIAWYHRNLQMLSEVPLAHLTGLVAGTPADRGRGRLAAGRPGAGGDSPDAAGVATARAVAAGDYPSSSPRAAAKTSWWRATSSSVVAGDIRAMLWNGVSRMPRFSQVQVQEVLQLGVRDGGRLGAGARGRGGEAVLDPGAQPAHRPRQRVRRR